jgi:guanine deaminase
VFLAKHCNKRPHDDMRKILRGHLVRLSTSNEGIVDDADGAVAVDAEGRIAWLGLFRDRPDSFHDAPIEDHSGKLLLPGFVDAHIHFPQYRMLAAPALDLLEWLSRYTFPEESRYGDEQFATKAAEVFLQRLFANGTTSALAFCSVHKTCAEALFAAAERKNMALITGKTMMDRNAIPAVQDTAESGVRQSKDLAGTWHGRGRLRYAVTPRFAITSSPQQLAAAGELLKDLPHALMQTHISESAAEIAQVKQLFPNAKDYTDVYDQFGLLTPRSLFAHGTHLSDREQSRLSETGGTVVHCPTSNAFLGSGIMPMQQLWDRRVSVGLATDVGGGTSYSMLATMAEAYKLQMLRGFKLSVHALFAMATIGNARKMQIDNETGNLEVGKFADVVVLDPRATPVLASRHELSHSIEDVLFSLMMLGDDRAIASTYVAGKAVHQRA